MPVEQSNLLKKLGHRFLQAADAHKEDKVKYNEFDPLPEIKAGVAQVVDCRFIQIAEGKKNAGEYMFFASAVIIEPKEVKGEKVQGRRTSVSEPLFDTPGRTRVKLEDHVAKVQDIMKRLGAEGSQLNGDNMERMAAIIMKEKPYIKFRTWQPPTPTEGEYADKEPQIVHIWEKSLPDYVQSNGQAVEDNTAPAPGGPDFNEFGETAPETEDTTEGDGSTSLESLVETASGADKDPATAKAIATLVKKAKEVGVSQEEIDDADNWAAVVELIQANSTSGESQAPEEDDQSASELEVGKVYQYQVIDPKTKKPVMNPKTKKPNKPVQVEVQSINSKTKTVMLKNMENTKVTYKDVPWDQLQDI